MTLITGGLFTSMIRGPGNGLRSVETAKTTRGWIKELGVGVSVLGIFRFVLDIESHCSRKALLYLYFIQAVTAVAGPFCASNQSRGIPKDPACSHLATEGVWWGCRWWTGWFGTGGQGTGARSGRIGRTGYRHGGCSEQGRSRRRWYS